MLGQIALFYELFKLDWNRLQISIKGVEIISYYSTVRSTYQGNTWDKNKILVEFNVIWWRAVYIMQLQQ